MNNISEMTSCTLFKTLLTSLANSLEQTSRWNIFPQLETQAPRSCYNIGKQIILEHTQKMTVNIQLIAQISDDNYWEMTRLYDGSTNSKI